MPVKAISAVATVRNGVGAFTKPCIKVSLQYCNWGGSSQGVRDFLVAQSQRNSLRGLAAEHKETVFEICKRAGHPQFTFHYGNGQKNTVDVRNLKRDEVLKKLTEYILRSGNPLFKYNHKVMSSNESVRGIWSPLHVHKNDRHRI